MTQLFLDLVQVSLSASVLILAVMLLRPLLRKAPKWITCALWALVAVRLLLPVALESNFSLMPKPVISGSVTEQFWDEYAGNTQTYRNDTPEYWEAVDAGLQPHSDLNGSYYVVTDAQDHLKAPATRKEALVPTLAAIWLTGLVCLGIYGLVSFLRLRKRVSPALRLTGNIYLCDYIDSPFILGLIRPRIYLPSTIRPEQMAHVVAHERAHLARKDHWWKPLGYGLLCLHWFNPLMWAAYILLCRDIELACDEKVIRQLGEPEKKAYSNALLDCSMPRYWVAACPLAFGEVGVKERVKTVLNYKKPAFWVILAAVIALAVTSVCFLTDPMGTRRIVYGSYNKHGTVCLELSYGGITPIVIGGMTYILEADNSLYTSRLDALHVIGRMEPYDLSEAELAGYLTDDLTWTLSPQTFSPGEALWLRMEDGTFYVWFQAEGNTYLGRGVEDYENRHTSQDATRITHLVQLEPTPGSIEEHFSWAEGTVTGIQDKYFLLETPSRTYRVSRTIEGGTQPWANESHIGQRIRIIYSVTEQEEALGIIESVLDTQITDGSARFYQASSYRDAVNPLRLPLGTDIFSLSQEIPLLTLFQENDYDFTMYCDDMDITGTFRIYDETTRQEVARSQLQPGRPYLVTAEYKALYCFRIFMPHDLGITLTARNMTPTSLTIDCVQSGGTYSGPFVYGETYTLEYYNGVKWVPVKTRTGTYQGVFPDAAYYLQKDESVSWYVDLNKHYAPLAPGHYRYAITFIADAVDNYSAQTLYAEFMIPSGSESGYYSLNQAILDGCVAMVNSDAVANEDLWLEFVETVNRGEPASVRYLTYHSLNPERMSQELFEESRGSYPLMTIYDLTYDGEGFTLRWQEGDTEYVQNWKYLMHYTGSYTPILKGEVFTDYYMLTDRNDVTYEDLINGMYSADFNDQIPFRTVYQKRTRSDEPTLAQLEKAKEALEPYMLDYSIATLDANELTGRLDIEVREWKDDLFDLIRQFIDPDFVTVTELKGELKLTE